MSDTDVITALVVAYAVVLVGLLGWLLVPAARRARGTAARTTRAARRWATTHHTNTHRRTYRGTR